MATEANATFFSISSSDLVSKWLGESERLVRQLFDLAAENAPSVIFIDEVDSLCGARGEGGENEATKRIKTEFLIRMGGMVGACASRSLALDGGNLTATRYAGHSGAGGDQPSLESRHCHQARHSPCTRRHIHMHTHTNACVCRTGALLTSARRRFEKRIYIPLPDVGARTQMFKIHIGDTPHCITSEEFRKLGDATAGACGTQLTGRCGSPYGRRLLWR